MLHRMIAASIAVIGVSVLAVPLAQGFNQRGAGLPLVNPGKPIPKPPSGGGMHPHFGAFHNFRRHEEFANGFPLWWGGYASDYQPTETTTPEAPLFYYPPRDFADRSRPQVFYDPGCRTDTQTVPSEAGGTRTITITRCY
jgi:hypothetical protein